MSEQINLFVTPQQFTVVVTPNQFLVRIGPQGGGGGGTGDVVGPAGAVPSNICVFNGPTGKIIADGGVSVGNIPSALPVPIAQGGTSATTAPLALAALGTDSAGTARPPIAHSSTHELAGSDEISVAGLSGLLGDPQTPLGHGSTHISSGSDPVAILAPASGISAGLDGLCPAPAIGEQGLFLRGDATWAAVGGGAGDVVGPAGAVDNNLASYDGVTGKLIKDSGTSAANIPTSLPVGIAEGGTGSGNAAGARANLGVDAAGTPRPPIAHASTHELAGSDQISVLGLSGLLGDPQTPLGHGSSHLSSGGDPIAEFVGASGVADGLDGLVLKPLAGQESLFLRGDATWIAPPVGGDVTGPAGAVSGNIATYDGVTGKLIQDAGVDTSTIPSALPVPIAEGGTGQTTAGAALTALGGDAAGTPRPPTAHGSTHELAGSDQISVLGLSGLLADAQTPLGHGSTHLSSGSDPVAIMTGASGISAGLDGLCPAPGIGEQSLFLRGDATWAATPGGGISGPGATVDLGVVVWDGTVGGVVADAGIRNYGASAIDPTTPAPADGDYYYNTAMDMPFQYDATRGSWLSIETNELMFNRSGNTGAAAYYRCGNRAASATLGIRASYNGTVIGISYTRQDVDAATFQATANGSPIASLASTSTSGSTTSATGTFSAGEILACYNAGVNATRHVIGVIRYKWRAT